MTWDDAAARLNTLDTQQALLTDGLSRMLTGEWVGFPSLQADLEALSPGIVLEPRPPTKESEAGPPTPPPWLASYDAHTSQPPQLYEWTCSACSLDWLKRALRLVTPDDIYASREATTQEIGYSHNINETWGLMDGSGAQLQRVLSDYGVPSQQAWLSFDYVYALAGATPGMMSGGGWYHWVGIRGRQGADIWIANSAPGYMGVWDILSRADFNRLGPFSVVLLDRRQA